MNSDLTFITNQRNQTLLDRFKVLIKDTEFFDVLVGYFYTSGFHELYKSLENTEKIRILVGISTNKEVVRLIERKESEGQSKIQFSHAEVKQEFEKSIVEEMEFSEDNISVEEGVLKFIEWLKNGKLEIKAYPTENIHAKLYIMTFKKEDRDIGRVITGSSNFTQAGLRKNLEFNVELKTKADYDFAKNKFNELWEDAVDIKDKYIESIQMKTWLNNSVTPYQLYLKFLYEYFKDDLGQTEEIFYKYIPSGFKKLEYQEQAVLNAKKILNEYGGVFISDVVGLGKTYVSAMLINQIEGRTLVVAPPVLLAKNNPGSWRNVFEDFQVRQTHFESIGKLDHLIKRGIDKYDNVIIDESHRFKTETTISYEKLAQICRNKKVILVSATPYNNKPKDILSQIKLFQKARRSSIPNLPDLESFFSKLEKRLQKLDRQRDYEKYMEAVKENASEIREKVLKYLMVRRTRSEIIRYFSKDLKKQKLKFPKVSNPEPIFYELNEEENSIFDRTIELVAKKFRYTRYTPMLYYKGELTQPEILSQRNMGKFMKILLVKRLESSFYAFQNTVARFINTYEQFLEELAKGNVYVSKKHSNKIFELLENDNEEAIQRFIDEDRARKYSSNDFRKEFKTDLENDLEVLRQIQGLWKDIKRDPKLIAFEEKLASKTILKNQKLIIFTESKETADYLLKSLNKIYPEQVLALTGGSGAATREKVIENFDAKAKFPKDDYRILIATEVLSEGVNLHRSNVVINYDLPWNPTRLMQRVGRINRVDTKFDRIHSFNFFPTQQSNTLIKLKEAAEAKIHAFMTLLGEDAQILTEGEPVGSHELFSRSISKKTITGEDESGESELKYLNIIKDIRDEDMDLFDKIKKLPKKARTAKKMKEKDSSLLSYFRKGKIQKFFISNKTKASELDFLSAAKLLEAKKETNKESLPKDFYSFLDRNKKAFDFATIEEIPETKLRGGRDSATQILRILSTNEIGKFKGFTEEEEAYIVRVIKELEEGGLPKQTTKKLLKEIDEELKEEINPRKILGILKKNIPSEFLQETIANGLPKSLSSREVILSEYFIDK